MKKVLSIVLALVMVMSLSVMLVPSASATTTTAATEVAGAGGKVFYEENFDDVDSTKVDQALIDAIGWSGNLNQYGTAMIVKDSTGNQKLRIVTAYHNGGNEVPHVGNDGKWAGANELTVAKDLTEFAKNAMVLEYKFTYQRREAGAENDVTVTLENGSTKTVRSNGQGSYQYSGFSLNGYVHFRINLSGDVSPTFRSNKGWVGSVEKVGTMNTNRTTPKVVFEYLDDSNDKSTTEYTNICDVEHTAKFIFDPFARTYLVYVDGNLYAQCVENGGFDANSINGLNSAIKFIQKPGMDVLLDDIKISDYEEPELLISEMMLNGTKANGNGKYQYIELYNPSDKAVNVYDYAIHIANAGNGSQVIDAQVDPGTDAWDLGGGSVVGYFKPGANTFGEDTFTNPALTDAVLQPGETAVVLLPQTAMAGDMSVSDTAFLTYLKTLNPGFDSKIFVCHNSDYNFTLGLLANENCFVNILRVDNRATDGGYDPLIQASGKLVKHIAIYAVSHAVATSKHNTSGSPFYASGNSISGTFGMFLTGSSTSSTFGAANDHSYEMSNAGWYAEYANSSLSFQKYRGDQARLNADGEEVYATPGYVPTDCRQVVTFKVKDIAGNTTIKVGRAHTEAKVSVETPSKVGFDTQIWLDGSLLMTATATTTEVTLTAAQMTNVSQHEIEVKYYRAEPQVIGFQKSALDADGNYTLRILAGATSLDFEELGFQITAEMFDGEMVSAPKTYYVQYVYTSVTSTVDGVETTVTAESLGYKYLFAVHITGIDGIADGTEEDTFDESLKFTVNTLYVKDGQMTVTGDDTTIFTPNK